ncbi:MAG: hypothetical protein A2X49_16340 [Lentisphaerae bacterium GWF2_52_8]|nr:MAG: hypothetical protein A2X49_16340 [Lentisphaerae bacterium GWF2_52_8]
MAINLLFEDPTAYFTQLVLVVFSICCHEFMHAWVALTQGDDTAARKGHLTLNPMIQMGPISLLVAGIIGIAWGSVPTNPHLMRHKYSDALVSLAGPAANLGLFIAFALLSAFAFQLDWGQQVYHMFWVGTVLNVVLFLFNMLPVPPLDGSKIAEYFFPRLGALDSEMRNGAMFLLFGIAFLFFKYFWYAGLIASGFFIGVLRIVLAITHIGPMPPNYG